MFDHQHATIRRYPISYVVEDARIVANNKIIRLGESVPSRMFSSQIRFSRCHRARVSLDLPIFLDDAGPDIAREQIFDVIFLPTLCPFVRPLVKDLLFGLSLHPANFLFSLPHFLRIRSPSYFHNSSGMFTLSLSLLITFLSYHLLIDFYSCNLFFALKKISR